MSFFKENRHLIWVIALSILYVCVQSQIALNTDIITLVRFAERIYDGMPYILASYETNLPSSIVLYLPVPFLMEFGLSWITATFLYGYLLFGILIWINYRYLKVYFRDISHLNTKLIIFYGLFMYCMSYGFFQKDYVITLLLIPYFAMEWTTLISMRKKKDTSQLSPGPIIMMSLACMIKPYYAIIPLFCYLWRAVQDGVAKRESFISAHFTVPSSVIVIITGLYWIFFPEFFTSVLPDILRIYVGISTAEAYIHAKNISIIYAVLFLATIVLASVYRVFFKSRLDSFVIFLMLGSVLFYCVFWIQGKGFEYHLYPAYIFSVVSFLLVVRYTYEVNAGFIILLSVFLATPLIGVLQYNPSIQEKKPMNKIMLEHYKPGTFIVPYASMAIPNSLHGYSDFRNVSRYPAFWPHIIYYFSKTDARNESDKLRHYHYFFEDLVLYGPDYVILPYRRDIIDENILIAYALKHADFQQYWSEHYRKDRGGEFDLGGYIPMYAGTMIAYDIYVRKSSKQTSQGEKVDE